MEYEHYDTHFQYEKNHLKEEGKTRSLSWETGLEVDSLGVECVSPGFNPQQERREGRKKGGRRETEKEDERFRSYFEENCNAPNLLAQPVQDEDPSSGSTEPLWALQPSKHFPITKGMPWSSIPIL